MSKFVGIKTYERFRSLWENNDIDEFSLNFILDTGQLYTHGVFINSAVFGTAANGAVLLSIAGTTNTLALSSHTHSNYYDKSENLDITNHKIISGDNDLLFCSGGALYIGNIDNPTYISGSTIQSIKGLNTYTILDTENFSISNTLPTGYTHNNTAYIEYGGNSFLIDYVKRVNTSLSFDYLNSYTLAGTNLLNGDYYGYINFTVDNVYNNPAWAQLRINITGRSIQYRTSADVNNWINLGIPSIPLNALNVAGIVSAPNANTQNKVWKTDEDGNPGWRDERIYSFASLVFQQIAGTELESYNTLTLKTILAGSNISFSCEDNVITINALDTTYNVFTGASASEDGSSGLVTAPNAGEQTKFLRGDGTWNTPLNTWRPIYLLGTATLSNSSTYLNIAPGNNISLAYAAPGTETGLSGNANYATLTISATNTWIAWQGATDSADGTAGYMPAPTSALRNLFLRGDGTWISLNDYTLPTATNLVLGGIKVGTTLDDTSGYTAIHIKDGIAYYKDTTYSFSNLLFLQTSGTNLMTYNSQAARTILAGSNITFTHNNNILTIAATDTTYSTVSKTAAGLCPILPNETTTTKYLRLDGTWVTPPDNNTWIDFTGASASAAGTKGVIQAPAGAQNKFFRGDNTWLAISQNVTSALYVGASNGTGNSAQSTNGNVYLIFAEGSSYSRYKIVGSGRASVTSDASGNITINSSGYSNFGAATASAAGSAGLVPAPGANVLGSSGYYLRADGTWQKPPNDNTWKAANASQEGYVPKSTANKILRANGDGALYWGDDANTTYTFYNLQFQNSSGTTVDTYKPTTSPTKTLKAGSNVTISAASNVITIASTNTWNANAVGVAGYVAAPTKAANANMVWKTDSDGNPAWRADANDNTLYYLTLNGTVNGTSGKTNLGTIWAPTSKGTGFLKCNNGTWSYDNTTYATSGHNHDSNYVIKKYYSAEQNTDTTKFWIRDIALDYPCSVIYNNSGSEWTYWVGLNTSNKLYGHIIRCSYANSGTLQFMYKSGGTADNTTNWSGWINVAHSNNSSLSTNGTTATIKVLGSSANVSLTSHNHNNSYITAVGVGSGDNANKIYYTLNGTNNYITVPYASSSNSVPWSGVTSQILGGNEFNMINNGYTGTVMWFNYFPRNARSANATTLTDYLMGNLAGSYANVTAAGFKKHNSDDTHILLGGGSHKLLTELLTAASLGASGNSTTLSVTVGGTTKTGSVTVPFATNATNATNATVLLTNNTSQAADSCYTGAPGLRFWRYNGTSSTTGQGGGDGWIMSWSWNSGSLGGQIYVDDNPSKTMCIRGYNNANGGSFTTWATMLHTDNWKSYITCSTLGAALADHTHTSFGNLTINGVITIGKNDNYGLAATANYSQLGFVDKYFWKCHVSNMYADNISSRDETKAPAFPKGLTSVANITAANFYTTSDRLKKQNISELSEHIRKFQMKDTKTWHYGVIALEVPEIFRLGEEGNMTVNYNSILSYYVGLLENRVKELELEVLKLKKNNYDNTK